MFCNSCGHQNADGARFCINCGADMSAATRSAYQQPNFQQPNYQQPGYQQPNYQQPNFQQPGYNPYASTGYSPMGISRREIITCILLSIVTCGIYGIYWLMCMVDDLNKACNEPQPTTGGTVVLLTLVTCGIYGFIWAYRAGEQLCRARQARYGYPGENNSVLYLVLSLFGLSIVTYCLIQSELNKLATQ